MTGADVMATDVFKKISASIRSTTAPAWSNVPSRHQLDEICGYTNCYGSGPASGYGERFKPETIAIYSAIVQGMHLLVHADGCCELVEGMPIDSPRRSVSLGRVDLSDFRNLITEIHEHPVHNKLGWREAGFDLKDGDRLFACIM